MSRVQWSFFRPKSLFTRNVIKFSPDLIIRSSGINKIGSTYLLASASLRPSLDSTSTSFNGTNRRKHDIETDEGRRKVERQNTVEYNKLFSSKKTISSKYSPYISGHNNKLHDSLYYSFLKNNVKSLNYVPNIHNILSVHSFNWYNNI